MYILSTTYYCYSITPPLILYAYMIHTNTLAIHANYIRITYLQVNF